MGGGGGEATQLLALGPAQRVEPSPSSLRHPRPAGTPTRRRRDADGTPTAIRNTDDLVVELDDGATYIVMELLTGTSLGTWARTGVELPRALAVLVQICDGLGAAHQVGVVHRDLHARVTSTAASQKLPDTAGQSVRARIRYLPQALLSSSARWSMPSARIFL